MNNREERIKRLEKEIITIRNKLEIIYIPYFFV